MKPKKFVSYLYLIYILLNVIWGFKRLLFCQVWNDIAVVSSVFTTKPFAWNEVGNFHNPIYFFI
jgi:hypothetical protein